MSSYHAFLRVNLASSSKIYLGCLWGEKHTWCQLSVILRVLVGIIACLQVRLVYALIVSKSFLLSSNSWDRRSLLIWACRTLAWTYERLRIFFCNCIYNVFIWPPRRWIFMTVLMATLILVENVIYLSFLSKASLYLRCRVLNLTNYAMIRPKCPWCVLCWGVFFYMTQLWLQVCFLSYNFIISLNSD